MKIFNNSVSDILYLVAKTKNSLGAKVQPDPADVMTICTELQNVLDHILEIEHAIKCMNLVKELHNHVHNH